MYNNLNKEEAEFICSAMTAWLEEEEAKELLAQHKKITKTFELKIKALLKSVKIETDRTVAKIREDEQKKKEIMMQKLPVQEP